MGFDNLLVLFGDYDYYGKILYLVQMMFEFVFENMYFSYDYLIDEHIYYCSRSDMEMYPQDLNQEGSLQSFI